MRKVLVPHNNGALVLSVARAFSQTIPDEINANMAAVPGNTWRCWSKPGWFRDLLSKQPHDRPGSRLHTKIFTSSAVFGLLGTNYAFRTLVYYNGTLAAGVLTDDLNLVSETT